MRRRNLPEVRHCDAGTLAVADIFSEAVHGFEHLFRHEHHDAPQPAAAPPIPHNESQEEHMISVAEFKASIEDFAVKLAEIDEDALGKAAAIKATPEGAAAFEMLHGLAQREGASGVLSVVGGILKGLAGLAPQPASIASDAQPAPQQPVPIGPVVAGQA